jgi:hypothetical protein
MKNRKMVTIGLLAAALVCGLALASCGGTESDQHVYQFAIEKISVTDSGQASLILASYFTERGVYRGVRVYTGGSTADCNAKAQAELNENKAKIDQSDLTSRLANLGSVSFTYNCTGDNFTGIGLSYSND